MKKDKKVQITIETRLITALVTSADDSLSALLAIVHSAIAQDAGAGYKSINTAIRAKTDCQYSTDSLQSLIKTKKDNPGKSDADLLEIAKKAIETKKADAKAARDKRAADKAEAEAKAAAAEAEQEAAMETVSYWEAVIASCTVQIAQAREMIAQIKAGELRAAAQAEAVTAKATKKATAKVA